VCWISRGGGGGFQSMKCCISQICKSTRRTYLATDSQDVAVGTAAGCGHRDESLPLPQHTCTITEGANQAVLHDSMGPRCFGQSETGLYASLAFSVQPSHGWNVWLTTASLVYNLRYAKH